MPHARSVPITAGHDFSNTPPLLPEAVGVKLKAEITEKASAK